MDIKCQSTEIGNENGKAERTQIAVLKTKIHLFNI